MNLVRSTIGQPAASVPVSHEPRCKIAPRAYQATAIRAMRDKKRFACLDAAGLGKTLEGSEAAQGPTLIATRTYLIEQWLEWLRAQYPDDPVFVAWGSRQEREGILRCAAHRLLVQPTGPCWIVVNMEMLRGFGRTDEKGEKAYKLPRCRTLIIDEAHHLRGRHSAQYQGALAYASQEGVEQVHPMTASPVMKAPDDAFTMLRILNPKLFTSYHNFLETYCTTKDTAYTRVAVAARNPRVYRTLIEKYSIARSYSDVALELPKLIEKPLPVRVDEAFMKTYRGVRDRFEYNDRDVNSMMEAMHIMRRLTHDPKLHALLELMQDLGDDEGVVIYTWYKDIAQTLAHLLKCPCVDGTVEPSERRKIAQGGAKTIVATMSAMSEGVDLSHFNHVVFFEQDYVPGVLYQALSRVRRWGPTAGSKIVTAYYIYVRNTLDEIVHRTLRLRTANIKEIMREALA